MQKSLTYRKSQSFGWLLTYNYFENILRLFDVSPQVKRGAIISNKHGIYELPHELPNDVRLRIVGN